jgi:hypothetical protein
VEKEDWRAKVIVEAKRKMMYLFRHLYLVIKNICNGVWLNYGDIELTVWKSFFRDVSDALVEGLYTNVENYTVLKKISYIFDLVRYQAFQHKTTDYKKTYMIIKLYSTICNHAHHSTLISQQKRDKKIIYT